MRVLAVPSGVSRLLSKSSRLRTQGELLLPFPDYPGNARSFVHLDTRLLPYWHTLFDVCPGLLKLDPPDGLNIFRGFMTWAYRNHPPLNWTYYLSVCRWLLGSKYQARINEEHIEAFMSAAAARWVNSDDSQARGWYWPGKTRLRGCSIGSWRRVLWPGMNLIWRSFRQYLGTLPGAL